MGIPLTLDEIQIAVYKEYLENDYFKMWNDAGKIGDIAEVGLINTEVSEALEEIRNKNSDKKHLTEELADIIIRVLNFASRKDIYLQDAILEKNIKNTKRTIKHGRDV